MYCNRGGHRVSCGKPGQNPVFFVEVDKFHKVHQKSDSRSKDQQSHTDFGNKAPLRTEVSNEISCETGNAGIDK